MSDLTPGGVFERFAGDLEAAATQVVQTEAVEAEARRSYEESRAFLEGAGEAANSAAEELAGTRRTVIGAIEATNDNPDDRDVLGTTMLVRGRSAEEIEEYFGHIDRIQSEEQPIAIVTTTEDVGRGAMVQVGYGLTAQASRSNHRVQFPKTLDRPDMRAVTMPVVSGRGFGSDREGRLRAVFATTPDDRRTKPVIVNVNHPFDRVHFAGTADEVDVTAANVALTDQRSLADHAALDAVGMPTMVAYGEEAVVRLAEQIDGRALSFVAVLNQRSLQNLGLKAVSPLSELTMPRYERDMYAEQFRIALRDLIKDVPEAASGVAFWAPLQEVVECSPEAVLEVIEGASTAFYSDATRRVVAEGPADGETQDVILEVRNATRRVRNLGVSVPHPFQIDRAARKIRRKAVNEALAATPRHKLLTRSRISASMPEDVA